MMVRVDEHILLPIFLYDLGLDNTSIDKSELNNNGIIIVDSY